MSHDELKEMSQWLQYEYMEPGETVFKAGDQGDKFYIILKGRCQLQIPDPYQINKNELKDVVSDH